MTPGFKPSITHFKGLRCCLVKNFNISGGELDGSGKKSTTGRFRVSGWKGVDVGTSGSGIAVACSIARYPQVVITKCGSVNSTWPNSPTIST